MRSPNFRPDYDGSVDWMPTVLDLIGHFSGGWHHLLQDVSGSEDDFKYATDILSRKTRLAVRVRPPTRDYRERFYWQITITCRRRGRMQAEFDKLLEWGDLMFYGHATSPTPATGSITPWFLLNMKRWISIEATWRHEGSHLKNRNVPGEECEFYWYDVRNLVVADPAIVLAASTAIPPLSVKEADA